jgi:hypothetical protein
VELRMKMVHHGIHRPPNCSMPGCHRTFDNSSVRPDLSPILPVRMQTNPKTTTPMPVQPAEPFPGFLATPTAR